MGFKVFTEKEINKQLLNKLKPEGKKGRSKHQRGWVVLGGKEVLKYKIPNKHTKSFPRHKARKLARSLGLSAEEYNNLIDCPLSGDGYLKLLQKDPKRLRPL